MNRRTVTILIIILLLALGLGAFYLFLAGGQRQAEEADAPTPVGVVHIRSIYKVGETNLLKPVGIGAAPNGDFWVTLRDSQKVVAFDRTGDSGAVWGTRGVEAGQLMAPVGIDGDPASGRVFVTDRSRLRLIAYDLSGTFLWERPVLNPLAATVAKDGVALSTFGPLALVSSQGEFVREAGSRGPEPGQFDYPRAIAQLEDGTYVVADSNNTRVQKVRMQGEPTATALWTSGNPPRFQDDEETIYGLPTGVTVDDEGRIFVLDGFRHNIHVLDSKTGKQLHVFKDLQGEGDGRFYLPTGIAYLGGNQFAVTDTYNDRVQIVRLLMPEDDNIIARDPRILLLLLLPLLLLGLLFGRKRYFATREFLDSAAASGDLRMAAAVYKRIHVLPEVYADYASVAEEGVAIREYLREAKPADALADADAVVRLAGVAKPAGAARLLLPRVRVLTADDAQAAAFAEAQLKTITADEFRSEYAVVGEDKGSTPQ